MKKLLEKKATLIIVREEVLGKKTPTQLLEVYNKLEEPL
jgi:hypothetical protein